MITREEAMTEYRKHWSEYRLALDDLERFDAGEKMDFYQPYIADSPRDPRWKEFIDTLDGYQEYWDSVLDIAYANLMEELDIRKMGG